MQTLEGEGTISYNGRTYSLPAHTGVLLYPGIAHSYHSVTANWATLYLTFDGSLAAEILLKLGIERSALFQWADSIPIATALWELIEVMDEDEHLSGLDGSAHIFKLLTGLKKHAVIDDRISLSVHMERLTLVLNWLEQHYSNPSISLEQMASVIGVSSRYLNRMFNSAFGVSAYQYLISFRMSKAKQMILGQAELTIGQIAVRSGYRDPSHFIAAFHKQEGTTPKKFKELYDYG